MRTCHTHTARSAGARGYSLHMRPARKHERMYVFTGIMLCFNAVFILYELGWVPVCVSACVCVCVCVCVCLCMSACAKHGFAAVRININARVTVCMSDAER